MARRGRLVLGSALVGALAALGLGAAAASGDTPGPPVMTAAPVVTGTPGLGNTLTTDEGSWSTSATFAYQWLRCDENYAGCTDIPGATATTYETVAADVGHVLGTLVTATNAEGSATALSTGMGPVEARPPATTHGPRVTGPKKVGRRVYETGDRWARAPYVFTAQWLRCSAEGKACVRITGKRMRCWHGSCVRVSVGRQWDYLLTRKDAGHRLRVRVAASNGVGRAVSTSVPTRVIGK